MTLSEEAHGRLEDLVALQPTKNAELQSQWDMESGSEVHQYLENELKDYYYRNEDSLICATPEAAKLVGGGGEGAQQMTVTALQGHVLSVLPAPDEEPQSVVSTLHAVEADGHDPSVDDVRSALRSLEQKGIVERVKRTVPTYRLAVERGSLDIDVRDD